MAFERVGKAAGFLLAPLTGAVAAVRQARMFHPDGVVYQAQVEPVNAAFPTIARKLEGKALVRFSTAWWRGGKEWIDALGVALRFGEAPGVSPRPGDQDLLFATIQHPWTMPFAPLTTEQHDFLANDYFAVSPFEVAGVGRCKLRLSSSRPRRLRGARGDRLEQAVARGEAVLLLELRVGRGPWAPVAEVRLVERLDVDQAALRFSPFRDGKGISPRGFVHMLRKGAYALSQRARPAHS